mmetsp:Transcript_117240/g.328103  ORF Transcript_117240/g.328103 Transcript_117240/m.328103 type:complete len:244 (+) Transcript_117240:1570-2301(+)
MHAVGHDASEREEVARRLRGDKIAQGADLLEEVRLRPARVRCGARASVRQLPEAELPLPRGRVLREGDHEGVHVLPVRHEAARGVARAADAHLVAPLPRILQDPPQVLVRLGHDPRCARVQVVRPDPEGAPRHGVEDRGGGPLQLGVAEGRPAKRLPMAPPAAAGLVQGPIPEAELVAAIHLVGAHAHLVVPRPAIGQPVAVAVVLRGVHRRPHLDLPPGPLQQHRVPREAGGIAGAVDSAGA